MLTDLSSVCCCQLGWRLDVNQEHEQDFCSGSASVSSSIFILKKKHMDE